MLVHCHCKKLHLIADNLAMFGDTDTNVERILEERGEEVRRISEGDPELLELDMPIEKDATNDSTNG